MAKTQKNTQRPQGATPQPSSDTTKAPQEGGMPVSGIVEAPASERPKGGPGPGIGCSRPGIR